MHLEEFSAEGRLDADAAEELTWATTHYASKIHLTIGDHRMLAQNIGVWWNDVNIRPGTRVFVEVANPSGDLVEEQRALVGFVDRFHEVQIRPQSTTRSAPWLSRLVRAAHRRGR